jgi:hypothetical protein
MAQYEKKHGDWILFSEDRKTNPKAPDYRGDILLDGVVYELSGWKRQSKSGVTFLAGNLQPKRERRSRPEVVSEDEPF